MGTVLKVFTLGLKGVNADKDPLELGDDELQQAQNAITDTKSGKSAIVKRPGFDPFNTTLAAGAVLGGVSAPLQDLASAATRILYIGRYPVI